jgi:hypothetical protein
MLPSETLFLDRDDVYNDEGARYRAYALYDEILRQVEADIAGAPRRGNLHFLKKIADDKDNEECRKQWHLVAEVAEAYPKLLAMAARLVRDDPAALPLREEREGQESQRGPGHVQRHDDGGG